MDVKSALQRYVYIGSLCMNTPSSRLHEDSYLKRELLLAMTDIMYFSNEWGYWRLN